MLLALGDYILGNEKLFKFTRRIGYVCMVPKKPAKIVLWHFQACILLECGLPYMVYSRMHISLPEMRQTMECHDIIKDWASLIVERGENGKNNVIYGLLLSN